MPGKMCLKRKNQMFKQIILEMGPELGSARARGCEPSCAPEGETVRGKGGGGGSWSPDESEMK